MRLFEPIKGNAGRTGRMVAVVADHSFRFIGHTNPAWIEIDGFRYPPRSLWITHLNEVLYVEGFVHKTHPEWTTPDMHAMSELVEECSA